MWLITGLLVAAVGYFVGWFFDLGLISWILAWFGFFIGKGIEEGTNILENILFYLAVSGRDYSLEPECPNCKVRGGVEIKDAKTLSKDNFVNNREIRYEDGRRPDYKREFWYVGEEQEFLKCNKCGHEWSKIRTYKRQIF